MQESPYLEDHTYLVERFKRLPFLESLDCKYLKRIITLSKIRKYEPGETITPEGAFDSWIYLLLSGAVTVIKQGREIAGFDHPGDTFGELAVVDGEARSASIKAETETVCLAIDASFLERVEPEDLAAFFSIFYRLFAEIISQRLRTTSRELVAVKEELERLRKGEKASGQSLDNFCLLDP